MRIDLDVSSVVHRCRVLAGLLAVDFFQVGISCAERNQFEDKIIDARKR